MFVVVRDEHSQKRAANLMTADAIMQEGAGVYAYWKHTKLGSEAKEQVFYSNANNVDEASKAFNAIIEAIGIHKLIGGRGGSPMVNPNLLEGLKEKGIEIVDGQIQKVSNDGTEAEGDTTDDAPDTDAGEDAEVNDEVVDVLETVEGTDGKPQSMMDDPAKRPLIEEVATMRGQGNTWEVISDALNISKSTAQNYNKIYLDWLAEGGDENGNADGTDGANEA